MQFEMRVEEHLPEMPAPGQWYGDLYPVRREDTLWVYRRLGPERPPFLCTVRQMTGTQIHCIGLPGYQQEMRFSRNLMDYLQLEVLLLQCQGLLLHASVISCRGRGILFSAPSGTGKSTQADLWAKYENAQVLNGDRAGIRFVDGCWTAFGLPYAGSSQIYRNESAPIAAIVTLEQSAENQLTRLKPGEAFGRLFPELSVHRWDPVFVERVVTLFEEMTDRVPVYHLRCRPDREAVDVLKRVIFTE